MGHCQGDIKAAFNALQSIFLNESSTRRLLANAVIKTAEVGKLLQAAGIAQAIDACNFAAYQGQQPLVAARGQGLPADFTGGFLRRTPVLRGIVLPGLFVQMQQRNPVLARVHDIPAACPGAQGQVLLLAVKVQQPVIRHFFDKTAARKNESGSQMKTQCQVGTGFPVSAKAQGGAVRAQRLAVLGDDDGHLGGGRAAHHWVAIGIKLKRRRIGGNQRLWQLPFQLPVQLNQRLVPAGEEKRMRIDLQEIFLALMQPHGQMPRPAHPLGQRRVYLPVAYLLPPGLAGYPCGMLIA